MKQPVNIFDINAGHEFDIFESNLISSPYKNEYDRHSFNEEALYERYPFS